MSDCKGLFTNNDYCTKKECQHVYEQRMTEAAIVKAQGYCNLTRSIQHEQIIKPDGTVETDFSFILTDILMLAVPILTFKLFGATIPALNNLIKKSLGEYSRAWSYFVENKGRPIADWPEGQKSFFDSFSKMPGMDWNQWSSWNNMSEAWEEGGLEAVGHSASMLFGGLSDITLWLFRSIYRLPMTLAHLILNKLPSYLIGSGKVLLSRAGKAWSRGSSDAAASSIESGAEVSTEIAEASEAISSSLDLFVDASAGKVGLVLLALQILGMIFDQWDPCNLKSELDNTALHALQDQMNTAFAKQLKGQFAVTTSDGAKIPIDVWPIPYFADAYALSFISSQGMGNGAKKCNVDSDCGPAFEGLQPICGVSGYCPVSWKDSVQRERRQYQNLYLSSLMQTSSGNNVYHVPRECITNNPSSNLFSNVAKGIGVSLGGNNTVVENWISKWWPLIFFAIAVILFVLIVLIK
jgi:hypothetical protein